MAPGQGQYAWNDYNQNGLKERNEFEVALFSDQQRFIRIYTPTNEYVKVLQNQLSISMSIRPSSILTNTKKALNRFANRWVLQMALRFDNKISDNDSINNYNPIVIIPDTFLLAANNNSRYSIFSIKVRRCLGRIIPILITNRGNCLPMALREKHWYRTK